MQAYKDGIKKIRLAIGVILELRKISCGWGVLGREGYFDNLGNRYVLYKLHTCNNIYIHHQHFPVPFEREGDRQTDTQIDRQRKRKRKRKRKRTRKRSIALAQTLKIRVSPLLLLQMAKLLSELEKFEQEMKELGSDISSVTEGLGAAPPLNPSPLPPRLHPPTIISPPSIPQVLSLCNRFNFQRRVLYHFCFVYTCIYMADTHTS